MNKQKPEQRTYSTQKIILNLFICVGIVIINFLPLVYYSMSVRIHQASVLFIGSIMVNLAILTFFIFFLWRDKANKIFLFCHLIFSILILLFAFPKLLSVPPFLTIEVFFLTSIFLFARLAFGKAAIIINIFPILFIIIIALMRHILKTPFTATIAGEILKPSPTDVLNFLTLPNIVTMAGVILTSAMLSFLLFKSTQQISKKHLFIASSISFGLFATLQLTQPEKNYLMPTESYNFGLRGAIRSVAKGIGYKNKYKSAIDALPLMSEQPLNIYTLSGNEGCVLIVHLGEGVSANHTSLNGYARNTTPYLKDCRTLINFSDCVSAAPLTPNAHIALLTDARGNRSESISPQLMPTCGSFLEALTHCHFKLYLMESQGEPNLSEAEGLDYAIKKLHPHADFSYATRNQKIQKENIEKILHQNANENICICFNNDGSHWSYYNYNKTVAPFTPADDQAFYHRPDLNPKEAEKVVNAYDNTIYDTDRFIQETIEKLQGRPYLYIYISDHGENVSQEDGWVRETDMRKFYHLSSCKVPFFFIASDDFLRLHPHFSEAMKNLRRNTSLTVSSGHLFHTVLGIFGIQTPYYKEEWDLSSEKARPYEGPHPKRNGEAADGEKWY